MVHELDVIESTSRKPFYIAVMATLAILALVVAGWIVTDRPMPTEDRLSQLEHVGAFIGGISSLITIVWLIATLIMQLEELGLQRLELSKQRRAWDAASTSIRGQLVIAIRPTFLLRLSAQANSIARHAYTEFAPDNNYSSQEDYLGDQAIHFLASQPDLEDRLSALKDEGNLLPLVHAASYERIYADFSNIVRNEVRLDWPIEIFIPHESPHVRLHTRLEEFLAKHLETRDEENQTSREFS